MVNNIDEIPDDIISHILSFLTIRDTVRARLSSPRWLNLPDSRAVIDLSFTSVLGNEEYRRSYHNPELQSKLQPKFVEIGNRFMQAWSGNKLDTLIIRSELGKEHFGEIDKWIEKACRMKVERIDILVTHRSQSKYSFPCTSLQHECKPYLKQLALSDCTPSFLDFQNTSWLSNLTALSMERVPLDRQRMNVILSSATNLISLELLWCELGDLRTDGQLLHLKKLAIRDDLVEARLNCPSLELLEFRGSLASIRFVHVPVLKEVRIWHTRTYVMFDDLNIQPPSLETLSITTCEDLRVIPPTLAIYSLKELQLIIYNSGFDLIGIKFLLNACPCLEVLELKMCFDARSKSRYGYDSEFRDERQLLKLRKVRFLHFNEYWNAVMFAKYILTNAVALEEIEIITPALPNVTEYFPSLRILQEKINPTARFTISHNFMC